MTQHLSKKEVIYPQNNQMWTFVANPVNFIDQANPCKSNVAMKQSCSLIYNIVCIGHIQPEISMGCLFDENKEKS